MATAQAPNPRASLLAGLRTGGVRSVSAGIPHTAAPGGSFNIPRYPSQHHTSSFPEEDEDELADTPAHNPYASYAGANNRVMPMTAAVDGPNNRFSQHQSQRGMNPNSVPFSPAFNASMMAQSNDAQTQAFQMQMMQLEMLRIQTIQQQYQAEMIAQAQRQQQQQQQQVQSQSQNRRASLGFVPPASAGPLAGSFDLRSATLRRASQAEHLKSQLGVVDEQVPMTAALGGKFGSRTVSLNTNLSRFAVDENEDLAPPPTPSSTTVISGGTSLGNPTSNNVNTNAPPSKSDSATSWRRGGNNNSVLSGNNRAVSSPSLKVTPPPGEQRVSPPPIPSIPTRARPQPLRFNAAVSQPLAAVAVDNYSDSNDNDDGYSTSSSKSGASNSSPTTPRSSSSNEMPLSPREEASKKLYEGLGIGRPVSASGDQAQQHFVSVISHRMASQPMRQPRGPPSGADELGPKNFATRIRRKAIGGLGMLMGARERREFVEAY
ncbi:hypothetical protein BD779DRAFT_1667283 [Infundibulicybe gibba]|nr:hypothetical protein BD779DRAFT_1667283 [Infundibulicybe gibba]